MIFNMFILLILFFNKCHLFTEYFNLKQNMTFSKEENHSLPFNMEKKDLALHVLPFI